MEALIKQSSALEKFPTVVAQLARMLTSITSTPARCSAVWCIGNSAALFAETATEVVRLLLCSFAGAPVPVKRQTLALAAECISLGRTQSKPLLRYALEIGRYDMACDVRSRVRSLLCGDGAN